MRVHLGSDHAGLDLKDHLLDWLAEHGYEPVDHGPFVYDAARRLPGLLPAGRRGRGRRPSRGDSLGVVIGGSGNGEQIAANKVARHPRRAGLVARRPRRWPASTTTPTWSPSAAGCTPLEDMTRFVEVFLATPFTGEERHVRRIGHARRLRDDRRPAAAAGVGLPRPLGRRCLRATPSTGSPTT